MSAPALFRQQLLDALPRLRRYARSLLADGHAADDLVQATLERALTHWHQYDQQRSLLAWLLGIAHNAHLDTLRRDRRVTTMDPADVQSAQEATPAGRAESDPGLRLDVLKALNALATEQREVLLLVSVECLSYAEAARTLGIPIGTVMSRISRARAQMRACLDGTAGAAAERAAAAKVVPLRRTP